jgi:4-amino-4-deoxy-L-arabinose transferase-like glycosyltransferase
MFVSVMGALAAAFVYGFGRIAFGRAVGATAAFLTALLPILVAHGRIAGHDTMVLFWWCASMLAMACWIASPREKRDGLAAFLCVFAATAGVFSRATTVWIFPVLVTAWLVDARGPLRQRVRTFPLAGLAGGGVAAALVFAIWPFMWSNQAEKIARIKGHWGVAWGDIEVYMGKLCLPAWHYFTVAFFSETPAVLLVAAAAGIVVTLAAPARSERAVTWVTVSLMWLVVPFAQTVSTLRIGAGRYVIQAWPGLLLFAALALVALGNFAASLAFDLSKRGRALVRASPALLAVLYTALALAHVEPYPLDYFNEFVGGPAGVVKRQMFEVPWWGEGNLAAVGELNRGATKGARVRLALWPTHAIPRLRDDLVAVDDATTADYVLVSHLQYFAKAPAGCKNTGTVDVEGAPLVDSYRCSPGNPTDLGFAAMTRGAPDEALPLFRDALQRDPRDPAALFGVGWAAQVKGNLLEAESFYVQAAARAAQTGDRNIEYFARFDLGTLYAKQGRSDDAATAFRAADALKAPAPVRSSDPRASPPRR